MGDSDYYIPLSTAGLIAVCALSLLLLILILRGIYLLNKLFSERRANEKLINENNIASIQKDGLLKEKELVIEKMLSDLKGQAHDLASVQFEDWKGKELEAHRKVIFEAAYERAKGWLSEWKIVEEKGLRKDAVTRSMGVNFGKITEHLVPFSVHLQDFDPRDIRFIGSPVDLMIFDGATAKKETIDIYFVEIKTGSGKLSKKQKTIRDAIESPFPRVHWLPIVVPEFKWDVPDEDE